MSIEFKRHLIYKRSPLFVVCFSTNSVSTLIQRNSAPEIPMLKEPVNWLLCMLTVAQQLILSRKLPFRLFPIPLWLWLCGSTSTLLSLWIRCSQGVKCQKEPDSTHLWLCSKRKHSFNEEKQQVKYASYTSFVFLGPQSTLLFSVQLECFVTPTCVLPFLTICFCSTTCVSVFLNVSQCRWTVGAEQACF